MLEPLSITASIVGITAPALHGIRLLLKDLQELKDAPKTVKRLLEDLRTVQSSLTLLEAIEQRDWDLLGARVADEWTTMFTSCTQACKAMRTNIQEWTKHSTDGKLAWRDRTNVGFFKQGQIKAMSEQLQNVKLSINQTVGIAALYSSVHQNHMTEDIRKMISVKQDEVKDAIAATDKQLIVLENKLEDLEFSSDDDDEEEEEEAAEIKEGKAKALQQLGEERKAIDASRRLLDELLLKAQEDAVTRAAAKNKGRSTTMGNVTFGKLNSGIQNNGDINGGTFSWGR